jgi:hypothetical protein
LCWKIETKEPLGPEKMTNKVRLSFLGHEIIHLWTQKQSQTVAENVLIRNELVWKFYVFWDPRYDEICSKLGNRCYFPNCVEFQGQITRKVYRWFEKVMFDYFYEKFQIVWDQTKRFLILDQICHISGLKRHKIFKTTNFWSEHPQPLFETISEFIGWLFHGLKIKAEICWSFSRAPMVLWFQFFDKFFIMTNTNCFQNFSSINWPLIEHS